MNILKLFKSNTNYPKQELSDKQKELLDKIDLSLVNAHANKPFSGAMCVKMTGVPFMQTLHSVDFMSERITLEYGDAYIPRSIALLVDPDGNWIIMYAIRCEKGSDQITTTLFIDALSRTNGAR